LDDNVRRLLHGDRMIKISIEVVYIVAKLSSDYKAVMFCHLIRKKNKTQK